MAGFYFYNGLDGIRMSGTGPDRRSLWRRASVARFSGEDVSRVLMIGARCVSVFVISASSAGRRRTARRPSRAASVIGLAHVGVGREKAKYILARI